jgi:O-acetyl-ADP-ribose deacetylase (regulator of RNase III)
MITWAEGDLFSFGVRAIAHGCNCYGVMGAGISGQFRGRYPDMYEVYRHKCARDEFRPGDVLAWHTEAGMVYNLATQFEPGANAKPWMITAAVGAMIAQCSAVHGYPKIALPEIGCGIGGLKTDDLRDALSPYEDAPVDLVVVTLKPAKAGSRLGSRS